MLSDTCFGAREDLAAALARYADIGYPQWQIDCVMEAMKLLARVQLVNDCPNFEGAGDYEEKLEAGIIELVNSSMERAIKEEKGGV